MTYREKGALKMANYKNNKKEIFQFRQQDTRNYQTRPTWSHTTFPKTRSQQACPTQSNMEGVLLRVPTEDGPTCQHVTGGSYLSACNGQAFDLTTSPIQAHVRVSEWREGKSEEKLSG